VPLAGGAPGCPSITDPAPRQGRSSAYRRDRDCRGPAPPSGAAAPRHSGRDL